jgi:hypothetical protein
VIFIPFMRGATMWEGQIGRVYWGVCYPRFWRTSGLGYVRLANKDGSARR